MDLARIDSIIDESKTEFLNRIDRLAEISPYRKMRKQTPAFAILNTADDSFYEYKYFERSLECDIRENLLRPLFANLFNFLDIEVLWPEDKGIYYHFSNESIEDRVHPFEFIIPSRKCGYRYTGIVEEDAKKLIKKYRLDSIVVLNWQDYKHHQDINHVYWCDVNKFLSDFVGEEIAEYIIGRLINIVDEANEKIGFKTIANFSLRYMSSFRNEIQSNLLGQEYKTLKYHSLDGKTFFDDVVLDDVDYQTLINNYIEKKFYKALLGKKGFAKCFVTAEYLYTVFKNGEQFDYTSVVAGYLKAVEQLIYCIVENALCYVDENDILSDNPNKSLWIKANGKINDKDKKTHEPFVPEQDKWKPSKKRPWHVRFVSKYKEYFDIALTPLINCLHDNGLLVLSDEANDYVYEILKKYGQECRNDHFHKDNIDNYEEVKIIRQNTYLIMFLLLGGTSITLHENEGKLALGFVNDSFSELYKKIITIPTHVVIILQYGDTKYRLRRNELKEVKVKYDEIGLMEDNYIEFFFADKSLEEIQESEPDLLLSPDNMPVRAWYEKYGGEQIEII